MKRLKLADRTMEQAYSSCINRLNSLQLSHQEIERRRNDKNQPPRYGVEITRRNLPVLGYSLNDVNSLKIIHVAGTKGKGSVCAYTESIIRAYGKRTGLFTSPHLMVVRDRFRICGQPISVALFVKYFNEVWDRLFVDRDCDMGYFHFLTLLSYHIFKKEGVDVCIYETGIGGEYDATNIISTPIVTGITRIGTDHPKQLGTGPGNGKTFETLIENIAWHKGGIFKAGCPAFSTVQEPKALQVLRSRALERSTTLHAINLNPGLLAFETALESEVQKYNASLAISLANTYLQRVLQVSIKSFDELSDKMAYGLKNCNWQGRFQSFEDDCCKWHIDGAHCHDSIKVVGRWFAAKVSRTCLLPRPRRILIFNQQSENRYGEGILKGLFDVLKSDGITIDVAIFTAPHVWEDGTVIEDLVNRNRDDMKISNLELQKHYAQTWKTFDATTEVHITSTIEEALKLAKEIGDGQNGMEALITGSLHLVGGALHVLNRMNGLFTP